MHSTATSPHPKKNHKVGNAVRMRKVASFQRRNTDSVERMSKATTRAREIAQYMSRVQEGKGIKDSIEENITCAIAQCDDLELQYTEVTVLTDIYRIAQDFAIVMKIFGCADTLLNALQVVRECRAYVNYACSRAGFPCEKHENFARWVDAEIASTKDGSESWIGSWSLHYKSTLNMIPAAFHSQMISKFAR